MRIGTPVALCGDFRWGQSVMLTGGLAGPVSSPNSPRPSDRPLIIGGRVCNYIGRAYIIYPAEPPRMYLETSTVFPTTPCTFNRDSTKNSIRRHLIAPRQLCSRRSCLRADTCLPSINYPLSGGCDTLGSQRCEYF